MPKLTGGCLCGRVRYAAEVFLQNGYICHCTICQRSTGQPAEITVPAGKKIKLVVENRDATPEEFESHALNREKVIAGKSKGIVRIGPLKPGRYPFIGEYNEPTAKGVVIAE